MLVDELYGVSTINNVGKALGKAAQFFTIGLSPDGAILGVSHKVFVLHELPTFFIKDSIENSKGVVAMGCFLRGEGVGWKVDVMKDGFLCDGSLFAMGVEGWCTGKSAHPWRLRSWFWSLGAVAVINGVIITTITVVVRNHWRRD